MAPNPFGNLSPALSASACNGFLSTFVLSDATAFKQIDNAITATSTARPKKTAIAIMLDEFMFFLPTKVSEERVIQNLIKNRSVSLTQCDGEVGLGPARVAFHMSTFSRRAVSHQAAPSGDIFVDHWVLYIIHARKYTYSLLQSGSQERFSTIRNGWLCPN